MFAAEDIQSGWLDEEDMAKLKDRLAEPNLQLVGTVYERILLVGTEGFYFEGQGASSEQFALFPSWSEFLELLPYLMSHDHFPPPLPVRTVWTASD